MKVAFFPYTYCNNSYIAIIQHMIAQKCEVINYYDIKKTDVKDIDVLYLNWIEDSLDDEDRKIINRFRENNKKVIWVFHNRVSHYFEKRNRSYDNIKFLVKNASDIIVLSSKSVDYLYEYDSLMQHEKVHFVPHPHFIGCYSDLIDNQVKERFRNEVFTFGSIGSLRRDKNADLLIKAFKDFKYKKESRLLIVGKPESEDYLRELIELSELEENIIIIPDYIKDYSVNYFFEISDVIMMPYDCNACMNSSVMLLAFSNKRTVITSNIAMADDYDDNLIYKYYYNEVNHIEKLKTQMEKAFCDGKENLHEKGLKLYCDMEILNSRDSIRNKLRNIIGYNDGCVEVNLNDEYLLKKSISALENWIRDMVEKKLIKVLKENPQIRIGLYGFGKYGKLMFQELSKEGIHVSCVVDKNKELKNMITDVYVCLLEELNIELDYLIVTTAQADVQEIRERMEDVNSSCYVFGLNDI